MGQGLPDAGADLKKQHEASLKARVMESSGLGCSGQIHALPFSNYGQVRLPSLFFNFPIALSIPRKL